MQLMGESRPCLEVLLNIGFVFATLTSQHPIVRRPTHEQGAKSGFSPANRGEPENSVWGLEMEVCRYCGQEIIYRMFNGITIPIHPGGACLPKQDLADGATKRITCSKCGQEVFRTAHNNGVVYFDSLGPPWPKHACYQAESSLHATEKHLADLQARLDSIRSAGGGNPQLPIVQKKRPTNLKANSKPVRIKPERHWRKCGYCPAVVTLRKYKSHLKKKHPVEAAGQLDPKMAPTVAETPMSSNARVGKPVEAPRADLVECRFCGRAVYRSRYEQHVVRAHPQEESAEMANTARDTYLTVCGMQGNAIQLTRKSIEGIEQRTIAGDHRDVYVQFTGVALLDILAKVAPPIGEGTSKEAASYYVRVEGSDGYFAILSWAEVEGSTLGRLAYLVTHRNGAPLGKIEGPFRLIMAKDMRSNRWVQRVSTIHLMKAG
jgi:hypothetical protein